MDPEKPEQTAARCCEALAIGFYWAIGPDA
jgi:hypothetical protein